MYKKLLASLFALGLTASSFAEKQILINGSPAEKSDIEEISFMGDNLILKYSDGDSFTLDIETVEINFSDATSNGSILAGIFTLNSWVKDEIHVSGVTVGTPIQIISVDGKTIYASHAEAEDVTISSAAFTPATYIIKIGSQIVKFIKK